MKEEQERLQMLNSRQRTVMVNGQNYFIKYQDGQPHITIIGNEIYSIKDKFVYLDDGTKVIIHHSSGVEAASVEKLKNAVYEIDMKSQRRINSYYDTSISSFEEALKVKDSLREELLGYDYRQGEEKPVYVYRCLKMKKDKILYTTVDDSQEAAENTQEAISVLFSREIQSRFEGDSKFSKETGKKKKAGLTDYEQQKKDEFFALVREVMLQLSIDNAKESMEFLKEYFEETMSA